MAPSRHPPNAPGLADWDLSPHLKQLPYLVDRKDETVQKTLNRLEEHLAEHSAVEETLRKLKACTDENQRHKNVLQAKIFRLRALIAPVRRVPLEVWSIIFGFLVASDPDAITKVGHVCTRWREATRFPRFWSHIIIGREGSVLGNKVNFFKERSGSCGLKVSYLQSTSATENWEAWDVLMNTAERWTAVALTFDDCMSASCRIPRLPHSSALRELSISIRGLSPISVYEGKFGFETYCIEKAPNLRSLTIFTHVLPRVTFWFTSLTKLHIVDTFSDVGQPSEHFQPIHGRSLTLLLLFFPALVEFIFDGEKSANWLCQNPARVDLRSVSLSLPNLRRLRLSCYFAIGCILLKEITAVNLEALTLRLYPRFESRSHQEPSAVVDAFLSRSPQLRSLTLYGLNHTALLHGLIRGVGLRQVEELHLEHIDDLQCIAEHLRGLEQHHGRITHLIWPIPHLSTLTVLASNSFDVPFEEFDFFIKSRYISNMQHGIPARIHNYVVNGQDLLKGAAPGTTVPFQRPVRFARIGQSVSHK